MVQTCVCGVKVNITEPEFDDWRIAHKRITSCKVKEFEDLRGEFS